MSSKLFCIPFAKFLTTFFSRSPKWFTFFASVVKFHENSLLGCPPSAASCPGNDIFLFFFCHLPTFLLRKLAPWMPPGWMPGAVAPLCTPLIPGGLICGSCKQPCPESKTYSASPYYTLWHKSYWMNNNLHLGR